MSFDSLVDPNKLLEVLRSDYLSFYYLNEEYDTPLKRKMFASSEDGKRLILKADSLRTEAYRMSFYIEMERQDLSNYDISSKSFSFIINKHGAFFNMSSPYNLYRDVLWFPSELLKIENNASYLSFNVHDDSLALAVENGSAKCYIGYKVKDVSGFKGGRAIKIYDVGVTIRLDTHEYTLRPQRKVGNGPVKK
jgi:protease II